MDSGLGSCRVAVDGSAGGRAEVRPRRCGAGGCFKKEMVDGDLKGAIDLYERILAQFSSSDRAAVAKALVRMGQCYEKLGSAEARKAYDVLSTSLLTRRNRRRRRRRGWSHSGALGRC